ncbi:hypothetical protein QH494_13200 [Sphingomonas sp. AR_OL41]|uniref:hypothetical protein n=1 Tax=Sphingomonas sp. AR_OL41 TaxID=3042729 RepID=UPI0024809CE7|nr:hypothetical protein [Sphingomonas sp. AR_OL41]MDH7973139.1 hypothetical protein [Sphingomonas sp. AR_OL41]
MLHKLGDGFLASPDAFMIDPITLPDVLGAHQSERAEQVQFVINHRVRLPYAVAWRNDRKWGGSRRGRLPSRPSRMERITPLKD